jgi:hypothetical protein
MNEYVRVDFEGNKYYYKDKGKTILHREDGPAVIGAKGLDVKWYRNGKLHRMDGPAIEYTTGVGYKVWYVNGVFIFSTTGNGSPLNKMR